MGMTQGTLIHRKQLHGFILVIRRKQHTATQWGYIKGTIHVYVKKD